MMMTLQLLLKKLRKNSQRLKRRWGIQNKFYWFLSNAQLWVYTQCLNWFWIKLDMLCFANALLYSQASSSTPPTFTCTYLFCPYIEFGNWEQIYENIEHVVISNQELSPWSNKQNRVTSSYVTEINTAAENKPRVQMTLWLIIQYPGCLCEPNYHVYQVKYLVIISSFVCCPLLLLCMKNYCWIYLQVIFVYIGFRVFSSIIEN